MLELNNVMNENKSIKNENNLDKVVMMYTHD